MTKILIFKKNGKICEFQVKGHSGYAESGSDIVCSGISVATQMAIVGLEEVLKKKMHKEIKDGYVHVTIEDFEDEKVQVILKSMELTLESIANEYAKHVKMEVREDVY